MGDVSVRSRHTATGGLPALSDLDEAITWELRRRSVLACEALSRILHKAVTTYGGDLEAFAIFLAVTCASLSAAARDSELNSNPPAPGRRLGAQHYRAVSRRAIAASTGLPRETVRRKIAALIDDGVLVAQGPYVRIPQDMLAYAHHRDFAETLAAEFTRTAAQLARISAAQLKSPSAV
jgi:hypothetical protein